MQKQSTQPGRQGPAHDQESSFAAGSKTHRAHAVYSSRKVGILISEGASKPGTAAAGPDSARDRCRNMPVQMLRQLLALSDCL